MKAVMAMMAMLAAPLAFGLTVGPANFGTGDHFAWRTEPVAIPASRPDGRAVFEFTCRGPVALSGVTVEGLDGSGKVVGKNFLWPSLKMPCRESWGKPSRHFMMIESAWYGETAVKARLRLDFNHVRKLGDEPPVCEFAKAALEWDCVPRATKTANWYVLGEDVVFRGVLPAGKVGLRVRVADADGACAFAGDVTGVEWRWRPPQVGFYTVSFAWLDASGAAEPAVSSFGVCGHKTVDGQPVRLEFAEFPRDVQAFAVSPAEPVPLAEATPTFGFNVSPGGAVRGGDLPFALIRLLGMHAFIRYHHFDWNVIEAKGRGRRDWKPVDKAFAVAKRNGYGFDRILVNAFGTPAWLTTAPANLVAGPLRRPQLFAPRDMGPWHDFVKAFIERYPEIRFFELWNEPHLPGYSIFWQKSSPQQFVDLMEAGYRGAKAAKPDVTVLMGGQGMRYQPFYEEYVRLGGVKWFDQLDTHCGYNMEHFRETERRYGAESKPYWEGEWHTVLYNCSPKEPPSEETCAYRMLVNMADLLHEGYARITGFGLLCGEKTPESSKFCSRQPGIQQVSGLFRNKPFLEPRLAALALRTATDRFRGKIERLGAWCFAEDGSQRLAAFGSEAGRMAFVWSANERMKPGAWSPHLAAALAGRRILDWTGRETSASAMRPMRVYFVLDPDLAAARRGVKLDHLDYIAYNYKKPLNLAHGGYAPLAKPVWNALAGGDVKFAADLDATALRLKVKAAGDALKQLVFAVDVVGKGSLEDVAEFLVTPDGTIVKPRTPALMGDIPTDFSPAGVPLKKSKLAVERADGGETWSVDIAMSDLYPFIHSPYRKLNVALVVTGAKGESRWGGGWEQVKKPAEFGELRPTGGGKTLATQGSFRSAACGEATIEAGETLKVRANGRTADVGPTVTVKFVPGSTVRATGRIRGNCHLSVSAWLRNGQNRKVGRFEAEATKNRRGLVTTADWQPFDCVWNLPAEASAGDFRLFAWSDPNAAFEIKDFKLVNE